MGKFKMVPVEPTEMMLKASFGYYGTVDRYRAMLAAAPEVAFDEAAERADGLQADEIHQMAFEEGQPADNGDGYLFTCEEFELFVERLLACARLKAGVTGHE